MKIKLKRDLKAALINLLDCLARSSNTSQAVASIVKLRRDLDVMLRYNLCSLAADTEYPPRIPDHYRALVLSFVARHHNFFHYIQASPHTRPHNTGARPALLVSLAKNCLADPVITTSWKTLADSRRQASSSTKTANKLAATNIAKACDSTTEIARRRHPWGYARKRV